MRKKLNGAIPCRYNLTNSKAFLPKIHSDSLLGKGCCKEITRYQLFLHKFHIKLAEDMSQYCENLGFSEAIHNSLVRSSESDGENILHADTLPRSF